MDVAENDQTSRKLLLLRIVKDRETTTTAANRRGDGFIFALLFLIFIEGKLYCIGLGFLRLSLA